MELHESSRTISVQGLGVCPLAPDIATLSVGVSVHGPVLATVRSAVGTKMTAAQSALIEREIKPSDMATTRLSVHSYRNQSGGNEYQVSTMLNATVREIAVLDEVINSVLDAIGEGAELHGVSFESTDRSMARTAARHAAFQNAETKAQHYAELAGVALDSVAQIIETDSIPGPHSGFGQLASMAQDRAETIPVQAGELIEQASIRVTWAVV